MIDFSSSVSGVQAASFRMNRVGHDLANVNTQGFEQGQVHQVESSTQGTQISHVSKVPNQSQQFSNTNIAEEMGEMIVQETSYASNLKHVKSQDRMLGELLDLVG